MMKKQEKEKISRLGALRSKYGVMFLVIAAVLVEISTIAMYWYASNGIRKEVQERARAELKIKNLEIQKVLLPVESAVKSLVTEIEGQLVNSNSVYPIAERLVKRNLQIVSAGAAFVPDYYPDQGRWFEPFITTDSNGILHRGQLGGAEHDYFMLEWYRYGIVSEGGYWCNPYIGVVGANKGWLLCSFSVPIHDSQGNTIGVFSADVSLKWVAQVINAEPMFPASKNYLVSRDGQLMVCNKKNYVMNGSILEITKKNKDTVAREVARQMLEGKTGEASVLDNQGEMQHVFYAPVKGSQGWSMAIICPDTGIYQGLRQLTFVLSALMFIGLMLMAYILYRSIRDARKIVAFNRQQASVEHEIHIASRIQEALLPKYFPPYPERKDVDIHASLLPAKDVAGDLYDFYIRDEKLFFCIGDVSGKGISSSLVMTITQTLFRNTTSHASQPRRIVSLMNSTLAEKNRNNIFVTCFVGVLDLPTGHLSYCNAGHNAPVIIGDTLQTLDVVPNIPLGVLADWEYVQQETDLLPQTSVFLYTDGVTEAMNVSHEQFGIQRMMNHLDNKKTPKELVEDMLSAVRFFADEEEQSDDITMLVVRYTHCHKTPRLMKSLSLPNDVQTVPQLNGFVKDICGELAFPRQQTDHVCLAVEEAVVNVMRYAYQPTDHGTVQIEAEANDSRLKFTITDSGIYFDPTTAPEADVDDMSDDRPIGGLGIHLIRNMMDSINYNRVNGKNVLTLRKELPK